MLALLIILALLLFLLLWIVFAPLYFYINTWEARAHIELYGLMRCGFFWKDCKPLIRMRILFIRFDLKGGKKKHKKRPKPRKRKRSLRLAYLPGGINSILKTFRLQELKLRLDTGDYLYNALLIPVVSLLNTLPEADCAVSFNGELGLECLLQNRVSRIALAFFRIRKLFF